MAKKLSMTPGEAPYKGHDQMCSSKTRSEHGTGTDAGQSKVTEGRKPPLKSKGGTGSEHGPRGYKSAKVKNL